MGLRRTNPISTIFYAAMLLCAANLCKAELREIYNTKLATSDLQWEKHPNSAEGGWEEVSSFDESRQNTIRSYQVCVQNSPNSGFWIRSPFISTRGGKQIHLEVEYSITRCSARSEVTNDSSQCKETFNLFYYGANTHIASSTFPPWRENPYIKVDTVAANNDKVNTKTFTFEPMGRKGFYIALQDQGACVALIALRVYYYYCPKAVENLVVYPTTVSGFGSASLVTVRGRCVANSVQTSTKEPQYRCSSNGQWQVATGSCVCGTGFEMALNSTACVACRSGTYKLRSGPESCVSCPENSGVSPCSNYSSTITPNSQCPCFCGYARAQNEGISVACTTTPSKPLNLTLVKSNATTAILQWREPASSGGRNDILYRFKCETTTVGSNAWSKCPANVLYITPSRYKIFEQSVQIVNLSPYHSYKLSVEAENGVSALLREHDVTKSSSLIKFATKETAPSAVDHVRDTDRSSSSITLVWSTPANPNGKILGYLVEYQSSNSNPAATTSPTIQKVASSNIKLIGLQEGTEYVIRIRAQTAAGYGPYSNFYKVKTVSSASLMNPMNKPASKDYSLIYIIAAGAAGAVLLIFVLFTIIRYKRSRKLLCLDLSKEGKKTQHPTSQNGNAQRDPLLSPEELIVDLPPLGQRLYVEYPDPATAIINMGREVDPSTIKIEEVIGKGEFAEVCHGKMQIQGQFTDVAVKRLRNGASGKDHKNFLREAATMAQFSHPNVIALKGVVTRSFPAMIITEYMENGSLDQYLLSNRGKFTILQLVEMLQGIANGMKYLSQIKYIHRDLAARNILVGCDLCCKVSDFGLSRTLENNPHATYTTQGGKIAIRWTAPECMLYRKFASSSDVWSFGIVAWEVMSYGEKPYWDMQNEDVFKNVQDGMRLPSPVDCPKILHKMMLRCWSADPYQRPEFSDLAREFEILLRQPSLLFNDDDNKVVTVNETSNAAMSTTSLSRTVDSGEVEKWLEIQHLSNYAEHFKLRGIDNLEKVSNLTLNDLKTLGIEVKLHIMTLESGIRSLKRHLSTCTSNSSSSRTPSASAVREVEDQGLAIKSECQDVFHDETT